jgi:hypothetical protein
VDGFPARVESEHLYERRTFMGGRFGMKKMPYAAPKVFLLGTVKGLTETTPERDKCSGSGDVRTVQEISPNYSNDCP